MLRAGNARSYGNQEWAGGQWARCCLLSGITVFKDDDFIIFTCKAPPFFLPSGGERAFVKVSLESPVLALNHYLARGKILARLIRFSLLFQPIT